MNAPLAAITGLGAISPFGKGAEALWNAALTGQRNFRNGFGFIPSEWKTSHPAHIPSPLGSRLEHSPALSLSLLAIHEAMRDAGWESLRPDDGIIIGSTTGQANFWESSTIRYLKDGGETIEFKKRYLGHPLGLLVCDLQKLLEHEGPSQTLASACCASTQAIAIASHWIASGKVRRCLVGGVELLCDLTQTGFQALKLIAPGPCRPFDVAREGINLSEAAAFLCLEKPGLEAYAHIRGFGMASDASHMTAPHPEGDGCRRAMGIALKMAALGESEIDWIHAHGTGSRHNDIAEAKAIRRMFKTPPSVSSTKSVHGHSLGAAGALESLIVCKALAEGVMIPTWGLNELDPEIDLPVLRETRKQEIRHVVKNTLAFGGMNASLVLSQ